MPGVVANDLVAAGGLVVGVLFALTSPPRGQDGTLRVLGCVLAASSAVLALVAADPPEGPPPCLQVKHCVVQPHVGPPEPEAVTLNTPASSGGPPATRAPCTLDGPVPPATAAPRAIGGVSWRIGRPPDRHPAP